MQRDMDLIRELMLKLEAVPIGYRGSMVLSPHNPLVAVDGQSPDEIGYHLDQIEMMGFLQPAGTRPMMSIMFAGLSPAGHEFIEAARNVDTWKTAKDRAGKVGNFTVGFIVDLLKAVAKAKAAEHGWM